MSRKVQFQILALILSLVGVVCYYVSHDSGMALAQKSNSQGATQSSTPPTNPTGPRANNPCSSSAKNPCSPSAKNACSRNSSNPCSPSLAENEIYQPATVFTAWKRITESPILSEAHEGMWIVMYANPIAQQSIVAGKTPFPVGSKLITDCFLDEDGEPGKRVAVFAMEKRNDGWLWVKTSIEGRIMRGGNSATMKTCNECHKSATSDSVFLSKYK